MLCKAIGCSRIVICEFDKLFKGEIKMGIIDIFRKRKQGKETLTIKIEYIVWGEIYKYKKIYFRAI